MLERLKSFVLLRGYKFTLLLARLRLFCLTYNTIIEKYSLPLHRRFWIQVYTQTTSIYHYLNSRRNSSIDMRPETVKNCDFMSILYSKTLREFKKPAFKIGDRVRISKYDLPFRKENKPQFTREVFEIVAIATRKPPTYTKKDEQDQIIRGKFYQKELIKAI